MCGVCFSNEDVRKHAGASDDVAVMTRLRSEKDNFKIGGK